MQLAMLGTLTLHAGCLPAGQNTAHDVPGQHSQQLMEVQEFDKPLQRQQLPLCHGK
jgi:hypothetical protein